MDQRALPADEEAPSFGDLEVEHRLYPVGLDGGDAGQAAEPAFQKRWMGVATMVSPPRLMRRVGAGSL